MQHDARDYGGLLQDTHTEVTGQQKKPATGGRNGLVWTALGLVLVTSNVRAKQTRADICKKHDVQTNVLISPVNQLIGARIYILDEDGMIMDFDTNSLEMEDISWGIDDDGNIFFLTDPTGKALISQLDVPHQVVALEAGRGNIRQQAEEQLDECSPLDDLTAILLIDQSTSSGVSSGGTPLPEETQMEEDGLIEFELLADTNLPIETDVNDSVSITPDII